MMCPCFPLGPVFPALRPCVAGLLGSPFLLLPAAPTAHEGSSSVRVKQDEAAVWGGDRLLGVREGEEGLRAGDVT